MLALIGGTGLNTLEGIGGFDLFHKEEIATPFADTQIQLSRYVYAGTELLFIPRHGDEHVVPPHRINYRGNIDALRLAGATRVVVAGQNTLSDRLEGVLFLIQKVNKECSLEPCSFSYGLQITCIYVLPIRLKPPAVIVH